MKIYFAGSENKTHYRELKKHNVKYYLCSYWAIEGNKSTDGKWIFNNEDIMLDSGGFTARIQGVKIDVKRYAKFINKNDIELAINLDTNDVEETLSNQKYLEKNTNSTILPVYHLSDYNDKKYRDLILKYSEEYPFICVGGMAGGKNKRGDIQRFLDFVYSKIRTKCKVHGLGLTGVKFLHRYPLYSADSTSWISGQRVGAITDFKDGKYITVNYKDKSKVDHTHIHLVDTINNKEYKGEKNYLLRNSRGIKATMQFENYITKLWEKRGITWGS